MDDDITDEELNDVRKFLICNGCHVHKLDVNLASVDTL